VSHSRWISSPATSTRRAASTYNEDLVQDFIAFFYLVEVGLKTIFSPVEHLLLGVQIPQVLCPFRIDALLLKPLLLSDLLLDGCQVLPPVLFLHLADMLLTNQLLLVAALQGLDRFKLGLVLHDLQLLLGDVRCRDVLESHLAAHQHPLGVVEVCEFVERAALLIDVRLQFVQLISLALLCGILTHDLLIVEASELEAVVVLFEAPLLILDFVLYDVI